MHGAPSLTRSCASAASLSALRGVVECQNPNADLTRFVGRIRVDPATTETDCGSSALDPDSARLGRLLL